MLTVELMKNIKDLSPSQQAIIDFMLKEKEHLEDMTIQDIARYTYTSPAVLIRVSKKLGFQGFVELKEAYLKELEYLNSHVQQIDANRPFEASDNIMSITHKIAALEKETIDDTVSLIDHDTLRVALNMMKSSKTIHFCGVSFSHLLGDNFALKMSRIGKRVLISQLEQEYLYTSALIDKDDMAIIVSYSGGLPLIKNMIDMYKSKHIPIIAITSLGQSYLRSRADVTVTITTKEKMYSKIAGFSNETSIKLILDILYSCYFALDYENNFIKKKELSHMVESNKIALTDILKEE
ncbi:MurR/RpiR family transcriptional regulator [Candidatus Stoquefichus massiliensis]|uniref:MurR/RpiR family transcriptional regulator n=1 Tax=Candidatus Stoquefichus massiliensis TaxID=1470350 RepID=UPI00048210CD|nr:MurR/RpiR family transcriptional regulator [Candidatus Stoquefichus massiliensis]